MPPKPPPEEYRWKPGQSGNPGGRPKGSSLTARLRRELNKDGGKLAELVVKSAIREALKGKPQQLKEIWDRVDGTVVQRVQYEDVAKRVLDVAERVLDDDQFERLCTALADDSATEA